MMMGQWRRKQLRLSTTKKGFHWPSIRSSSSSTRTKENQQEAGKKKEKKNQTDQWDKQNRQDTMWNRRLRIDGTIKMTAQTKSRQHWGFVRIHGEDRDAVSADARCQIIASRNARVLQLNLRRERLNALEFRQSSKGWIWHIPSPFQSFLRKNSACKQHPISLLLLLPFPSPLLPLPPIAAHLLCAFVPPTQLSHCGDGWGDSCMTMEKVFVTTWRRERGNEAERRISTQTKWERERWEHASNDCWRGTEFEISSSLGFAFSRFGFDLLCFAERKRGNETEMATLQLMWWERMI